MRVEVLRADAVGPHAGASAPEPADPSTSRRSPWFIASLAVVVAGAALRCWHLGQNPLGFDEAFTAMAGRRSIGGLLSYLRVRDSHPPLDYVLRSPLSRAGLSAFWLRVPSVACSVAAVALMAWWMRRRGLVGLVATALLAFDTFEVVHGRDARMYADLEVLGIAVAMVTDAWLVHPRRRHLVGIGLLVGAGLLLHTSMFLVTAGLLLVPGVRRDREAWRWRLAIVTGIVAWAVAWGPSFVQQAQGGHSNWIPRTTFDRAIHTFGALLSTDPSWHLLLVTATVAGVAVLWRVDRRLARVVTCCSMIPLLLAALAGVVAPVLLDRTLTAMAWGPIVALAFLVELAPTRPVVRSIVVTGLATLCIAMAVSTVGAVSAKSDPQHVLEHLDSTVRPGDVVAMRPGGRIHLLEWTLGVRRNGYAPRRIVLPNGVTTDAMQLAPGASALAPSSTGRVWLLDWYEHHLTPLPRDLPACALPWHWHGAHVYCLELPVDASR